MEEESISGQALLRITRESMRQTIEHVAKMAEEFAAIDGADMIDARRALLKFAELVRLQTVHLSKGE